VQDVQAVFDHIIPKLMHGNDGLIFTMNACPYYPGTCQEILKWKPKSLNTIDFDVRPLDQA
jgi:mRNA guanylyltransferase